MKNKIIDIINKAGIRDVGFCPFSAVENKLIKCRAISRLPKNSKTVILCVFPYKVTEETPVNISRYAAVPDYHRICGEYLKKICDELKKHIDTYQFEYFIDNSPIPEVSAAAAAGLGVKGKNNLLITEKYGSFVFIGEIVTDLYIDCTAEIKFCGNCGMCEASCPKFKENCDCLSAVSQQKGELSPKNSELLKKYNIVWGCDICAENCPLNKNAQLTYIKEFKNAYRKQYVQGEDISGRAYEWRGEKTVLRNYKNIGE